jgi:hypothetical protein
MPEEGAGVAPIPTLGDPVALFSFLTHELEQLEAGAGGTADAEARGLLSQLKEACAARQQLQHGAHAQVEVTEVQLVQQLDRCVAWQSVSWQDTRTHCTHRTSNAWQSTQ